MRAISTCGIVLMLAVHANNARALENLATYIDSIRAVDHHAHVVAPDAEHDTGYDALPCDALASSSPLPPANLRFGPDLQAAWKALYGFSGIGNQEEQIKAAHERQATIRAQHGPRYFEWVLDQASIEVVLANRIAMPPQLARPRFLWVPYADALLFPLDNTAAKAATPDRKVFFEKEEQLLKTYLEATGATAIPASLDEYLKFVTGTLTRQKSAGAIAIKLEVAYLRALDFAPADPKEATAIYDKYRSGGEPTGSEYKTLQDLLFHHLAAEAGRLGLAVHIHTGTGCGEYFDDLGASPLLLAAALNDPALRGTTFVLLHGGRPVERTITALILKPNVYVDTSVLEFMWSAPEMARILRPWLETMPERVLFGSDAGPFGPGQGWEETTWLGSRNTRRALALALTEMVGEDVITEARAREIATRVLRDNAVELYHLDSH
jgi:uncharacterized protein